MEASKEWINTDTNLEKECLGLKASSNLLNQRADALLFACQVIAEYRMVNGRLLALVDKLKTTNANQIAHNDGGSVPGVTPPKA